MVKRQNSVIQRSHNTMTLLRLRQYPIMFFVIIFKTTVLEKVNDKDDESTEDYSFSSTHDL